MLTKLEISGCFQPAIYIVVHEESESEVQNTQIPQENLKKTISNSHFVFYLLTRSGGYIIPLKALKRERLSVLSSDGSNWCAFAHTHAALARPCPLKSPTRCSAALAYIPNSNVSDRPTFTDSPFKGL